MNGSPKRKRRPGLVTGAGQRFTMVQTVFPIKPSNSVEKRETIQCLCGYDHDDGFLISCDGCSIWQHCACLGIADRKDIPDEFRCDKCTIQERAERAKRIQLELQSAPRKGIQAKASVAAITAPNPQKRKTEEGEWTKREGEKGVSYKRLIGAGGYGEIHELYDLRKEQAFARKLTRPFAGRVDETDIANEVRAIDALCKGAHVNIVEVFRHGRLRTDSAFYFIDMELCQANLEEYTLGKEITGLASWTAAFATKSHVPHLVDIMRQICDGLVFIHSPNEVHRDLNPQNVLFVSKSGHWKIADFGLTSEARKVSVNEGGVEGGLTADLGTGNMLGNEFFDSLSGGIWSGGLTSQAKTTRQSRGKPGYRASELLQYPKSILHELATGEKVFQTDTATFEFAMSDQKVSVQLPLFDKPARSAISELLDETLRIDFRRRPTAEVVRRKISELISREMEPREAEISTASKTMPVGGTAGIPTRRFTRALAWN